MKLKLLLALLALVALLSGCPGPGAGTPPPPPDTAERIEITSERSFLLTQVGETAQLSAVVYDRHGRRIDGAVITWTSSDPEAVSVTADGLATALVPTGFARVTASHGALAPQRVYIAVAQPAAETTLIDKAQVLAVAQDLSTASLARTEQTLALQAGDIIVSNAGILSRVTSVQVAPDSVNVTLEDVRLQDAFDEIVIEGVSEPVEFETVITDQGITVQSADPRIGVQFIDFRELECRTAVGAPITVTLTGADIRIHTDPIAHFKYEYRRGFLGIPDITAIETYLTDSITITGTLGKLEVSVNGSVSFTCTGELPASIGVPLASLWGIVSVTANITPAIGFSGAISYRGASISVSGPRAEASVTYTVGLRHDERGWAPIGNFTRDFDVSWPGIASEPSHELGFYLGPLAKASMGLGFRFLHYEAVGLDMIQPRLSGGAKVNLPFGDRYATDYRGSALGLRAKLGADLKVELTGLMARALNFFGIDTGITIIGFNLFTLDRDLSPRPELSSSAATVTSSVDLTARVGNLLSGSRVEFVAFRAGATTGTVVASGAVNDAGVASASWTPPATFNGNVTVVGLLYDQVFGLINRPFRSSNTLALEVQVPPPAEPGPPPVAPPSAPVITAPGTATGPGPVIEDLTPTLQWNTLDASVTEYAIGISRYPYGYPNDVIYRSGWRSGRPTSYTVTRALDPGTRYRWRLEVRNAAGNALSNRLYFQTSAALTPTPSFTFSLDPTTGSAAPGGHTITTATITPQHNFTGNVTFTPATTWPTGITLTGGPVTVPPGATAPVTAPLTIAVAADVAAGEYPLTIAAASGDLRQTANFTLTVTPTAPPPPPAGPQQIYIADTGNHRIVRTNDMTGAGWTAFGTYGLRDRQFGSTEGIFVDGQGRIYIADSGNSRIVRMDDMEGRGWTAFGVHGGGVGQFSVPSDVFVDGQGRIYVADTGNHRIVQMDDMEGRGWITFGSWGSAVGQFSGPRAVFVDGQGRIYIADSGNNSIVRINDMAGRGWITFGSWGSAVGQFSGPSDVFVDGQGRIYIADAGNHRIVRMADMAGAGWTAFGASGNGVGQFSGPSDVFVDGQGRIYIADTWNHRIVRMADMAGAGWTEFGVDQARSPRDVFVDGQGRIYIAETERWWGDPRNPRIVRMDDMAGRGWTEFGADEQGINQFNSPSDVFVDGQGRIYVVDSGNSRIVRMDDMAGRGWIAYGATGRGIGQFNSPRAVFVDGQGRIYVVDSGNSRIVRMDDMAGRGWTAFGVPGDGVDQFNNPSDVFVDGQGRIYIADTGNRRIVRMNDMEGRGWIAYGAIERDIGQLGGPRAVFVDGQGRIYIADWSWPSRIVRINDMTGAGWTEFGTGQFHSPQDVVVDGHGRIYVTETGDWWSPRPSIVRMDDMEGTGWITFGEAGSARYQFSGPAGIFIR